MRIVWFGVVAAIGCDGGVIDSAPLDVDCSGQGAVIAIDADGEVTCGAAPGEPDFSSFGACPEGDVVVGVDASGQVLCEPDANGGGDVTSVVAGDGLVGGGTAGDVVLAVDYGVFGACDGGQVAVGVDAASGEVVCAAVGDVTGISAGAGLTGGGATGDVGLAVDPTYVQRRVQACDEGAAIRAIDEEGAVTCEADDVGAGDVTGVAVGDGMTGGGDAGDVGIGVSASYFQRRAGACSEGTALRALSEDGSPTCDPLGDVTGLTVGDGLTGGGDAGALSIGLDPAWVQRRVSASCGPGRAIRAIGADGSITCTGPRTCMELRLADPTIGDGYQTIYPRGEPLQAYCDMTTDGGGWTIVYAAYNADGTVPLVSDTPRNGVVSRTGINDHFNMRVADKIAISALSRESILVRMGGNVWVRWDRPLFDPALAGPATHRHYYDITLTSSDGVEARGVAGWSTTGITRGGDYVVGTTIDHHNTTHYHLNAGCAQSYLYSFSGDVADGDAGYDVSLALGAWSSNGSCDGNEGGRLFFYAAMR